MFVEVFIKRDSAIDEESVLDDVKKRLEEAFQSIWNKDIELGVKPISIPVAYAGLSGIRL
jgi:hypothetical protein